MPNIEKLERAVTFIKDHPEQHRQDVWTCETGACLAGHVALQEGWQVHRHRFWNSDTGRYESIVSNGDMVKDGLLSGARDIAIKALDIDDDTAAFLFHGTNTAENIEKMAKMLANGETLTRENLAYDSGRGFSPRP